MKFLIENYSDYTNTQSLYFYSVLKSLNHECFIYDQNSQSMYDALDKTKPDYFITNARLLMGDFISYINNENVNVKLLLNVSNLEDNDIMQLDQNLKNDNINSSIFFTNKDKKFTPKPKYSRIISLNDAADINLNQVKSEVMYNMTKAFFILEKLPQKENSPHHVITNIAKLKQDVDIFLSETQLSLLYSHYDEIIFYGISNYIPQSFFDAIMLGKKVYYMTENNKNIEFIDLVLKPENSLNYSDNNKLQDFTNLKNYVLEKHSSVNRVKTLLSQLPKE